MKCHSEGENLKMLYDHRKKILSLQEIDIAATRKKMERIGSLLITDYQKYKFYHWKCSFYRPSASSKNQGKSGLIFLMLVNIQIVNLKTIKDVLWFIERYQCGGETLVPVVKHPVRHSITHLKLDFILKNRVRFRNWI